MRRGGRTAESGVGAVLRCLRFRDTCRARRQSATGTTWLQRGEQNARPITGGPQLATGVPIGWLHGGDLGRLLSESVRRPEERHRPADGWIRGLSSNATSGSTITLSVPRMARHMTLGGDRAPTKDRCSSPEAVRFLRRVRPAERRRVCRHRVPRNPPVHRGRRPVRTTRGGSQPVPS